MSSKNQVLLNLGLRCWNCQTDRYSYTFFLSYTAWPDADALIYLLRKDQEESFTTVDHDVDKYLESTEQTFNIFKDNPLLENLILNKKYNACRLVRTPLRRWNACSVQLHGQVYTV